MEKKSPKIIIVAGIERSGSSFILRAICESLRMGGKTFQIAENLSKGSHKKNWQLDGEEVPMLSEENIKEVDFLVIRLLDYSIEMEAKSNLVFTSTRKAYDILTSMHKLNVANPGAYGLQDCLDSHENLVKWMRSSKLAYCMDFNAPLNHRGLHNYMNLRNIILPLNYCFKIDLFKDAEGKNIDPKALIEAICPELVEVGKVKEQQFNEKMEARKNGEKS